MNSPPAFFCKLLSGVLATLMFWTPLGLPRRAHAQERSPEAFEGRERVQSDGSDESATGTTRQGWEDGRGGYHDASEVTNLSEIQGRNERQVDSDDDDASDEEAETTSQSNSNKLETRILPDGPAKPGVSTQSISLPSAEGSIEGMGESFTPNLSSGTGTFGIPVALPAGRAGVNPSLSLNYSTSGGNGPLGFGWNLAVPFISRQTDKGLPRYLDATRWQQDEDTFMYNGGQELVPVSSEVASAVDGAPVPAEFSGWQQYRSRVEGSFMRFFRSPDAERWVVQAKDGTRFDFGQVGGNVVYGSPALQRDPDGADAVFSWHLTRMTDVHGATVYYQYFQDGGNVYLEDIYYDSPAYCAGANPRVTRNCAAPTRDYGRHVHLVYETREDTTSSYITTWRTETNLRLKRIEITSQMGDVGTRYLVRRYHLRYDPSSYHSLLTRVQVEGRPSSRDDELGVQVGHSMLAEGAYGDGVVGELLPPMRFTYTQPEGSDGRVAGFGGIDATVHDVAFSPPHSVSEGRVDLFDVNSDGLPDVLVTDPAAYQGGVGVFFNGPTRLYPAAFSRGVTVAVPSAFRGTLNLANPNIAPMDVDGDGRTDVMHMPQRRQYGYFVVGKHPTKQGRGYEPTDGWYFEYVPSQGDRGALDPRIDLANNGDFIKTLDVNNDHLIDVVRTTGTKIQTWLNLGYVEGGQGRFGQATAGRLSTAPIETCLPVAGRAVDFADPETRIADMNGDGLQDIVRMRHGEVMYFPGRGPGAWGAGPADCDHRNRAQREIRMDNAPRDINPEFAGVHLMDINADGASDLIQVGLDSMSLWFNRFGMGFTDRLIIRHARYTPNDPSRVRITDLDGSGTQDIVIGRAGRWLWIDPMGGQRPRLLKTVDNGLGALTTLEYSTSAIDYLRDLNNVRSCQPGALDCFSWQQLPRTSAAAQAKCDAHILEERGRCVHHPGGSPVISTVVRRVRTTDRLDTLGAEATVSEAEYAYHDGYYEGIEQEFRGFGAADARILGDDAGPDGHTRTYFHQGRRPNDIATDRLADNPNEALKGRQFLTEIHDGRGTYQSTQHATYTVRRLMKGLNGVDVSYAFVAASDQYRYDTTMGDKNVQVVALPSVLREEASDGLLGIKPGPAKAGDAEHPVVLHSTNRARLRRTIDSVDNVGNLRAQTAHGRVGVGEDGEAIDSEAIVSHAVPIRLDDSACQDSAWLWRSAEAWTRGAGDGGQRLGHTAVSHNACGDVVYTAQAAVLPNAGPGVFGPGSEADGFVQEDQWLESSTRVDAWGQPVESCAGADLSSGVEGCLRYASLVRDEAYAAFVVRESIATGGTAPFTRLETLGEWDEGLGVLESTVDPNGLLSEVVYDGLGRLTATLLPNVGGCEGKRVPTTRIEYDLTPSPASRPLSRIHTMTELSCQGVGADTLHAYAYVDGVGRRRVTLSEGDENPLTWSDGKGHPWILSGRQVLSKKGQPRRLYQPAFFDDSPDNWRAVLTPPAVPTSLIYYDSFDRVVEERDAINGVRTHHYSALSAELCDEGDNGGGQNSWANETFAGTCTTQRMDGHGRVIDQHLRNRYDAQSELEHYRLFSYYRADGAVQRIVRARTGEETRRPLWNHTTGLDRYVQRDFVYDTAARRIRSLDPDTDHRDESGNVLATWRYLFNRVGDVVGLRDPRGCGQNFYYDLAGRLVAEAYVDCAEAQTLGEASVDGGVPAGALALERVHHGPAAHVRYHFDEYPDWVNTSLFPSTRSGTLGRATGVSDRGQRTALTFDNRGNAIFSVKQMALIAEAEELRIDPPARDPAAPFPRQVDSGEITPSVQYDDLPGHTYTQSNRFDHGGRSLSVSLPRDPDNPTAPALGGRLEYTPGNLPARALLRRDNSEQAVIEQLTYTRDGLVAKTVYGDGTSDREATFSTAVYDGLRRPTRMATFRTPTPGAPAKTLGAVSEVVSQALEWDQASNLVAVYDQRHGSEWPEGHRPQTVRVAHDALYRVRQTNFSYTNDRGSYRPFDRATDWRTTEALHRAADPMRAQSAPSVIDIGTNAYPDRVVHLDFRHDWLANMTEWHDDANAFYERAIGNITNGADTDTPGAAMHRPSALYLANNLNGAYPDDLGGWLEAHYGVGGNLLRMTVHAQCTDADWDNLSPRTQGQCKDHGGTDLDARRSTLSAKCTCAAEQHYRYQYDELNRLSEARRYDRHGPHWRLAARQRYRYDSANQRTVKQTLEIEGRGETRNHRAVLYVSPGDFERRGLTADYDEGGWAATAEAESQYLIAGARVVWKTPEAPTWDEVDQADDGLPGFAPTPAPPEESASLTDLPGGAYTWIRADHCASEGEVLTCRDISGQGNDATSVAPDKAPLLDTLSGMPALAFDSSYMSVHETGQTSPTMTVFLVASRTAPTSSLPTVWRMANVSPEQGARVEIYRRGLIRAVSQGKGEGGGTIEAGKPAVIAMRVNRDEFTDFYKDGVLQTRRSTRRDRPGAFILGGAFGSTRENPLGGHLGHIAEFLLFDDALSDQELQRVNGYLVKRYLSDTADVSDGESNDAGILRGIHTWMRADHCADEAGVFTCEDLSRQGNTLKQHNPARTPTTARMNGRPALRFSSQDGTGDALEIPAADGASSFTTIVVASRDRDDPSRVHLWAAGDSTKSDAVLGWDTATVRGWTSHRATATASTLGMGIPVLLTLRAKETGELTLYVNGQATTTRRPTETPTEDVLRTLAGRLGAHSSDGYGVPSEGLISEFMLFGRALADDELDELHGYLIDRYRLSHAGARDSGDYAGVDPEHRITFSVTNLIQSTSAVIDLASGQLLEATNFYPNGARENWWSANEDGVERSAVPLEPVGFTGKESDGEVGLVYFGERYLVPRIGRWATPDPLAVHAMGGGESLNSYHYVAGNLLQARDPWGLEPKKGSIRESLGKLPILARVPISIVVYTVGAPAFAAEAMAESANEQGDGTVAGALKTTGKIVVGSVIASVTHVTTVARAPAMNVAAAAAGAVDAVAQTELDKGAATAVDVFTDLAEKDYGGALRKTGRTLIDALPLPPDPLPVGYEDNDARQSVYGRFPTEAPAESRKVPKFVPAESLDGVHDQNSAETSATSATDRTTCACSKPRAGPAARPAEEISEPYPAADSEVVQ